MRAGVLDVFIRQRSLLLLSALTLLVFAATAHADVHVTVTALPAIPGHDCQAIDINATGDVLVYCHPVPGVIGRSYVWSSGARTDITGPDGPVARCVGINAARQVACNANSGPFLWQNGSLTSLAPGMQSVFFLNDLGEVVGETNVISNEGFPLRGLRRANGSVVTMPATLHVFPGGLNNLSQAAVRPLTPQLFDTVGTWSPTAGYVVSDRGWDLVTGINDAGQLSSSLGRAMLFTPGRGWQALPSPPGFPAASSFANAVNAVGQVAGWWNLSGTTRAVFWISRAAAIDLGPYQTMNTRASASNPSGQVVGVAFSSTPEQNVPLIWTVTNVPTALPQPAPTDVAYAWVPTDDSGATGRMTVSTTSGPFSVAATRITSLQFTFQPGVSVELREGVEPTGRPIMSFDGVGLDSGTVRLRRGPYPADVLFSLHPDQFGDEAAYDPLGEGSQSVVRRGRWIREGAVPPAAFANPRNVLGVIDVNPIVASDPFGTNTGIAYDTARNRLYLTRGAHNSLIYIVSTTGTPLGQIDLQAVHQPGYIPETVTYDPASDHLFVFTLNANSEASVLEMTAGGSVVREIPVAFTNGMVRADGIWLNNGQELLRYSFAGDELLETVPISESFQGSIHTSVSTAFPADSSGAFLLVDETPGRGRIVRISRDGETQTIALTSMLDADHRGGGRAVAIDPPGNRMFLLTRSGYIFVLSADFMNTQNVTSSLQLTGTSVSFSSTPSPAGPSGSYTVRAQFQNTSSSNICSIFFQVTELTVDGRSLVDQLEVTTLPSTGQQLQGFGDQLLGHIPVNLDAGATQEFAFKIDLGARQQFNFFVDAWGTPAATQCQ